MAATGIEWTRGPNGEQGYSFSPWIGCTEISPACNNCYAREVAKKMGVAWNGPVRPVSEAAWNGIFALDRRARREGTRFRVFPSMCDPLDNNSTDELRERFWRMIEGTPNLDWMILTKRPQLARRFMPSDWFAGSWPRNVWFGFTAENQREWDRRWLHARLVPTPMLFVSAEPLLEGYLLPPNAAAIGLFIVGGESGTIAKCRVTPPGAFDLMEQQCADLGIPFFMKQLDQASYRGTVVAGERDGKLIRKPAYKHFPSFPAELRVRDQPRISRDLHGRGYCDPLRCPLCGEDPSA